MSPCEIPNFEALVSTLAENNLNEQSDEYDSDRCCLGKEPLCDMTLTRAHDDTCMSMLPTSLAQANGVTESENAATWTGTLSETGPSPCAVDTLMLCDSFTTQLSACTNAQSAETLGDKSQIPLHDYFARGMTSPLASLLEKDEANKDKDNRRRKKYSKSPGFYSVSPMTKNRYMNPQEATFTSSPTNTTMPKSARLTMDMNMEPNCDYCDFPSPAIMSNASPAKNGNNGPHIVGDDDEVGDGKDDDDDDISPRFNDENYLDLANKDGDTNTANNYNEDVNVAVHAADGLENDARDGDEDDEDDNDGENCLDSTTAITGEHSYYNQLKKNDLLNVAVDINSTTSSCATSINTRLQNSYIPINERCKENQVFIKILATQLVSGTIIGRGGKGLNWFRRKSRVGEIKLSMPWELYPKTEYRTLLFRGSIKSVLKATCIIADLMLSKYSANHAKVFNHTDKMIVMVVLPCAFQAAMEDIKKTTDPAILNITLFKDDGNHREIVAVLKGNKTKIKELVVAIVTSISETVDPADYCFVSYPNAATLPLKRAVAASGAGVGTGSVAMRQTLPSADQMELGHHYQQQQQSLHHQQYQEENWRFKEFAQSSSYPGASAQGICNTFNMESLDDKVKNQHVVIQTHLPPHLITRALKLANIYKCNFQATNVVDTGSNGNGTLRGSNTGTLHSHGGVGTGNDNNDDIKCEISGPFGDCCTAASIIFSLV